METWEGERLCKEEEEGARNEQEERGTGKLRGREGRYVLGAGRNRKIKSCKRGRTESWKKTPHKIQNIIRYQYQKQRQKQRQNKISLTLENAEVSSGQT